MNPILNIYFCVFLQLPELGCSLKFSQFLKSSAQTGKPVLPSAPNNCNNSRINTKRTSFCHRPNDQDSPLNSYSPKNKSKFGSKTEERKINESESRIGTRHTWVEYTAPHSPLPCPPPSPPPPLLLCTSLQHTSRGGGTNNSCCEVGYDVGYDVILWKFFIILRFIIY